MGINTDHSALLDFEEKAPKSMSAKQEAIRQQLGLTPITYYQCLNMALDDPAMLEKYPQLVARLRRIRESNDLSSSSTPIDTY
ncbi:DUF3263 domain-containing protein [Corynebacterium sp. HS2168-gen11]|uniref:DUF3263 domain-containing protein n=1 Tax=Corynebacterium sp. HS2168-gen11 TaxID=2974027 RepID=UPI00216ABBE9|nr:DUF3263 domain-containing protein [Corynebacterium sp. HS2168-gen11]MCS4536136.1 DUF3263 domain-containing protein [Corynebacterium sp. HS2168-gen11]